MPLLPLNRGFTEQPTFFEIDNSHPLAGHLVFCWLGGRPLQDQITKKSLVVTGNPVFNPISVELDGVDDAFRLSPNARQRTIGDCTIISRTRLDSTPQIGNIFALGVGGEDENTNFVNQLSFSTTRQLRTFWEFGDGNNVLTATDVLPSAILGVFRTYAVTRRVLGTSSVQFYLDGSPFEAAKTGLTNPSGGGLVDLHVGLGLRGSEELTGAIEYVYEFDIELSPAQITSITNSPYQILKPVAPQIYFIPEAVNGAPTTRRYSLSLTGVG
ncbi:MAG: LamG-like jellyroll fold domain-containing protein [Candidatus Anammoxibacter sp.]